MALRARDYTVYKTGEEMPGDWFIALITKQYSSGSDMVKEALRQAREQPQRLNLIRYGVQRVGETMVFGFSEEPPPKGS